MKKIKITFFLIAVSVTAWSQTNTFPSSGNVGIGTTSPSNTLHVFESSSGNGTTLRLDAATNMNPNILFSINGQKAANIRVNDQGNNELQFQVGSSLKEALSIAEDGKIGIGTNSARSVFNINADNGESWINQYGHLVFNNKNASTTNFWTIASRSNGVLGIGYGSLTNNEYVGSGSDIISINSLNGKVGIGVNNPDSKLVVDGKIRSEEVKVEIINGPDYVFAEDYELRTLQETKEYISENKHLPEIPSAKEMEVNGIDLGDMNMRLLKKIEELTLYLIEQNSQNQAQQAKIEQLELEIKALKNK